MAGRTLSLKKKGRKRGRLNGYRNSYADGGTRGREGEPQS